MFFFITFYQTSLSTDNEWDSAWIRVHDRGMEWLYGNVDIPVGNVQLTITAVRGASFRGDIALDDLTLRKGSCTSTGMNPYYVYTIHVLHA